MKAIYQTISGIFGIMILAYSFGAYGEESGAYTDTVSAKRGLMQQICQGHHDDLFKIQAIGNALVELDVWRSGLDRRNEERKILDRTRDQLDQLQLRLVRARFSGDKIDMNPICKWLADDEDSDES